MTSGFALGSVKAGPTGLKFAALTCDGKAPLLKLEPQPVIFEPDCKEERANLVMRASAETARMLEELDEQVVALCASESVQLFGETLSIEETRARYKPCLRKSDKGYEPSFRVKIGLAGSHAVRCWDGNRKQRPTPQQWAGLTVESLVHLQCVWIGPTEFGCLLECRDLLISESEPECPF